MRLGSFSLTSKIIRIIFVLDFVAWYRQLYGVQHETEQEQTSRPESPIFNDSFALEYLSKHNYDTGKACFHLGINFSHGKGLFCYFP